ncbi:MAG TPA: pyridoxamine 5'-phosphate oxidase [Gaiellaceae bacterium]|nr:pyridoxamine 5'-phosphate oxidase [Gaiellaceae bacterium]
MGARDSGSHGLDERDVDPDPLRQFRRWFDEAAGAVRMPEAMALATATPDAAPSVRMVLLKHADERGFAFFTGYASRKGRELEANPRAALLFHWDALGRQVRVDGAVERLAPAESDQYFATRPRGSRLAAWAAVQSEPLPGRDALDAGLAAARSRFGEEGPVPRPPQWGGYRLRPARYEVWQHRDSRLHDRLAYEREGAAWRVVRLAP